MKDRREGIIELVEAVADDNAGAFVVQSQLQWFNKWAEMLRFCKKRGYIGSSLWELYKDKFNKDSMKLGYWILEEMRKEKEEENESCKAGLHTIL